MEKNNGRTSLVFSVRGPIPIQLGNFSHFFLVYNYFSDVKKNIPR